MNYLAHLHIASHTKTSLAGALGGDFVRGSLNNWPEPIRTGLKLHRWTDSYIDQHPLVLALKTQFPSPHRRVAGILLDLAFDHQLAKNWTSYHSTPLATFTQHSYRQISIEAHLPAGLQRVLGPMTTNDWLVQYQRQAGIEQALKGIARRLSKPELLLNGIDEIWRLEPQIETTFGRLYPQLLQEAQKWEGPQQ